MPIAACTQATAQQIAWSAIGRRAIRLDPRWRGGDYYDAAPGDGPHEGLAIARMVAQVTFRSDDVFTERFGREPGRRATPTSPTSGNGSRWSATSTTTATSWCAASTPTRYLVLGKAMDLHDVARGRGSRAAALARIQAPVLSIGIWSDMLYPSYQQRRLAELVVEAGAPAEYVEIDSPHGHDAFLIDVDQVGDAVSKFLAEVES